MPHNLYSILYVSMRYRPNTRGNATHGSGVGTLEEAHNPNVNGL
jgi:hypothetical protein